MPVFAAVEGGGTTFRVALSADGDPTRITDRAEIETTTPGETLRKVRDWLRVRNFDALGVASFGPIEPQRSAPNYGYITKTPKLAWTDADILGVISDGTVPCKFDTDVNAPAYAEFTLGKQAPSSTSCVYVTVGTGVGIGVVANKKTVHGLLHPEGGHVCIKRQEGDTFPGTCPFHGDCVEGLVSAAALAKRADVGMKELAGLADDDPVWDSAAHTLASLCVSMILIVSPDRIVLSGGIMQRACLFPMIHEKVLTMLNGYVQRDRLLNNIETYITDSTWGNDGGLVGALALAQQAYDERSAQAEESRETGPQSVLDIPTLGVGIAIGSLLGVVVSKLR